MDVKIKTFRIQSASDEQALNEFLTGKIVRHWGTQYERTAEGGIWNLMLAYEPRVNEPRSSNDHRANDHRSGDRGSNNHSQRNQPKPTREKAPREDYQPQIAQADMPLFEAIRKWRNARAREERIKPFALFNNKQLEEMVKAKPTMPETLHALVPDMDATLWEKYQNELSGFISAASQGHAAPALADAAAGGI